jgi:hypothetical protein
MSFSFLVLGRVVKTHAWISFVYDFSTSFRFEGHCGNYPGWRMCLFGSSKNIIPTLIVRFLHSLTIISPVGRKIVNCLLLISSNTICCEYLWHYRIKRINTNRMSPSKFDFLVRPLLSFSSFVECYVLSIVKYFPKFRTSLSSVCSRPRYLAMFDPKVAGTTVCRMSGCLPIDAASHLGRAKLSLTPRLKPLITHLSRLEFT